MDERRNPVGHRRRCLRLCGQVAPLDECPDYQGRIDFSKASFFGFDITKKHGVKKVAHLHALIDLNCENGDSTGPFNIAPEGSLRVDKDHTFSGKLTQPMQNTATTSDATAILKVSGKLGKRGVAQGKVSAFYDYTEAQFRGQSTHIEKPRIVPGATPVSCSSGTHDWKAKRGAIVNPKITWRSAGRRG